MRSDEHLPRHSYCGQSGTEAAGVVAPATSSCSVPVPRLALLWVSVPADQPAPGHVWRSLTGLIISEDCPRSRGQ